MKTEKLTLLVNEMYASLQGESTLAGRPCVLVRLTGCHLRCRWCDSERSFTEGTRRSVEDILEEVEQHGIPLVLVTGGEPLLQKQTPVLLARLVEAGFEVQLETSGTLPWHELDSRVSAIVDVKCPGSGESEKNRLDLLQTLRPNDEVKFVIADRTDYEYARETVETYELGTENSVVGRGRILFSPVWGELDPEQLAQWILKDRLPVRFQLQLHKILWGPDATGV